MQRIWLHFQTSNLNQIGGQLKLQFSVNEESKKITLNAKNIKIEKCFLKLDNKRPNEENHINKNPHKIDCSDIKQNKQNNKVKLQFKQKTSINQNQILHIKQSTEFSKNLFGAQLTNDTDQNGKSQKQIATKFEPNGARQLIPCIDEPSVKSIFKLSVISDVQFKNVLSNASVKRKKYIGDLLIKTDFNETPYMSTQLIAIIIGNFDSLHVFNNKNLQLSIQTPLRRSNEGEQAANVSLKCLDLLEKMFKIPQPMTKLDLVSIKDFSSTAMENWGLITFKEVALLTNNDKAAVDLLSATETIVHELVHQWFGNLVTMRWWNDLWLNESFATFISHLVIDKLLPDYKYMQNQYGVFKDTDRKNLEFAFDQDSQNSTHRISSFIQSVDNVKENFSIITYVKGAAILRNFQDYMGEKNFLLGLQNQLSKQKQSNASENDLFKEWDNVTGMDISKQISSWIDHKGLPVLKAEQDGKNVVITQTKFTYLPIQNVKENSDNQNNQNEDQNLWQIPLKYRTMNNNQDMIFKDKKTILDVNFDKFLHLNCNSISFLRVNYDDYLTEKLISEENINYLTKDEIQKLIDDAWAFQMSGSKNLEQMFKIINSVMINTQDSQKIDILIDLQKKLKIFKELENININMQINQKIFLQLDKQIENLKLGKNNYNDYYEQKRFKNVLEIQFDFQILYGSKIKNSKINDQYINVAVCLSNKDNKDKCNQNELDTQFGQVYKAIQVNSEDDLNQQLDEYRLTNNNQIGLTIFKTLKQIDVNQIDVILNFIQENEKTQDLMQAVKSIISTKKGFSKNQEYVLKNQNNIDTKLSQSQRLNLLKLTMSKSRNLNDFKTLKEKLGDLKTIKGTLNQIEEKINLNSKIQKSNIKLQNDLKWWQKNFL